MRPRTARSAAGVLAAVGAAAAIGCGPAPESVRIGAKPFAEQEILAEMLARLVGEAGLSAHVRSCDDSYTCNRALRWGELDVMVEYSGTALQFVGGPEPDRTDPLGQVRMLFAPLGLRWLEPLGFDNGYRILVPAGRGAALGLASIADLDRIPGGVRVACPSEFLRRPRDGLASMARRYGLSLAGEPVVINDPQARFDALLHGRADVAVGYATDGAVAELGLAALSDPLGFFPPYQAAIVIREATWSRHPELRRQLAALAGELPNESMRQLNSAVQVEGRPAREVAGRFLQERGLTENVTSEGLPRSAPLRLATTGGADLEGETALATRALREVFPGRPFERLRSADVVASIESGRARFGVSSAERLFPGPDEPAPRVEAVAVLGTLLLHLVRRADDGTAGEDPFRGRVGTLPPGSSSGRIAVAVLGVARARVVSRGSTETLLERVAAGELDAALIPAASGRAEILRALGSADLTVAPLGDWLTPERAVTLPFLRRVRLPADRYGLPVETLGAQVLLVGPGRAALPGAGLGSPAAALSSTSRPVTLAEAERLAEATGFHEMPDPTLPSAWISAEATDPRGAARSDALESALSLLCVLFLVWLAYQVVRKPGRVGTSGGRVRIAAPTRHEPRGPETP